VEVGYLLGDDRECGVGREEAVASTTVRRPELPEEGIKPMVVEPLNIVSGKRQDF
jgi:hypothetical protein